MAEDTEHTRRSQNPHSHHSRGAARGVARVNSESAASGSSTPPNRGRASVKPVDPKKVKKRRRRRRIALFSSVFLLLLSLGSLAGLYFFLKIPLPAEISTKQVTNIYYSDGKTVMTKLFVENRTSVPLSKVPAHVQHAILAAEDRSFYENGGISVTGIGRAMWANIRGGDISQGGSTITQQYVKNAFLGEERTFSRKSKEIVMAIKMDQNYTKDEILERYINTIYFGLGSYGIEAASQAYFGVSVDKITVAQAALMATMIKYPPAYTVDFDSVRGRWNYVLDGMVEKGWLSSSDRAMVTPPKMAPRKKSNTSNTTEQIVQQIRSELAGQLGADLTVGGYQIYTTIDKKAQDAAVSAATEVMKKQPQNLNAALVAVEPNTGNIRAYYGGTTQFDVAKNPHQAGSSFKPYVLATALQQQISLKSLWDSTSPRTFDGHKVNNAAAASCNPCNLIQSTAQSLNTVYWALAERVKLDKVAKTAMDAGIRTLNGKPIAGYANGTIALGGALAIGDYTVSPLDHANGFATFAAQGVRAPAHFVKQVRRGGDILYQPKLSTSRAFSTEVAADSTYAMQAVIKAGSAQLRLSDDRPAAGKTGTVGYNGTNDNSHAWMAGFTPQLAATVWVGQKGKDAPIYDARGRKVYGIGLPGQIWRKFMNAALSGEPVKKLPTPSYMGDEDNGEVTASPTPSPSPTQSSQPTQPTDTATSASEPATTPTPTPTSPTISAPSGTSTAPRPRTLTPRA